MDTGASIQEKKMIILNEHDGGLNKRKPSTIEESVRNLSRSSLRTLYAWVPHVSLPLPQRFAWEHGQSSDSSYPRGNKRKMTKVYHSLPMSYRELLPILIKNYGISVIPTRPRSLHIWKSTMSMPNVNTMEELEGILRRIARSLKTKSRP